MGKCTNTPYIRRPLVIYDFATAPFWISLWGKFYFLFYQCGENKFSTYYKTCGQKKPRSFVTIDTKNFEGLFSVNIKNCFCHMIYCSQEFQLCLSRLSWAWEVEVSWGLQQTVSPLCWHAPMNNMHLCTIYPCMFVRGHHFGPEFTRLSRLAVLGRLAG